MPQIVLLRHGQSTWNLENRFTGWTDVDLSEQGYVEARSAGQALRNEGFLFDIAYTSLLKRAIRTLWIALDELDLMWIPQEKNWRLNERHYGALQGLDKAETAAKHSEEQVHIWRRSYDVPPPELETTDERFPGNDPRYRDLKPEELPKTESLKDTVARFLPYWENVIAPAIQSGQRVLIAAHGNSLRALVMHLQQLSEEEVLKLNIPTGLPLLIELDDQLNYLSQRYLGDSDQVAKAQAAVAAQGKAKA